MDLCAMQAFAAIAEQVREDIYAHQHLRYYVREVRVLAYSQVSHVLFSICCGQ